MGLSECSMVKVNYGAILGQLKSDTNLPTYRLTNQHPKIEPGYSKKHCYVRFMLHITITIISEIMPPILPLSLRQP